MQNGKVLLVDAFPLSWPSGWKRTERGRRTRARYEVSFAQARDALLHSLRLLGARDVVISSNVPVKRNGMPYANPSEPDDSGVAVYWTRKGHPQVMACDCWIHIRSNLRAIGLTIDAMRQMQRAGASDLLDRAFAGFTALPMDAGHTDWRVVLELENVVDIAQFEGSDDKPFLRTCIREAFRRLARTCHPDTGGSHERSLRRARTCTTRGACLRREPEISAKGVKWAFITTTITRTTKSFSKLAICMSLSIRSGHEIQLRALCFLS